MSAVRSGGSLSLRGRGRGRARTLGAVIREDMATVVVSKVNVEDGKPTPSPKSFSISELAMRESLIESPNQREVSPPTSIRAKVELEPLKLADDVENGAIRVKILKVNIHDKFVYILVEDNQSTDFRKELETFIQSMYASSDGEKYRVAFSDVCDGEILVLGDQNGYFRRARILQVDKAKETGIAIDVDTCEQFDIRPNLVFKLTPGLSKVPMQAVKCRAKYDETKTFIQWVQENEFLLQNRMLLENSLLAALELAQGKWVMASGVQNIEERNELVPFLSFNVLGSQMLLKFWHISLIYQFVPRMPPFGLEKVAFITDLNRKGEVQIVVPDITWRGIRDLLHDLQVKHKLFTPRCAVKTRFHFDMVRSFTNDLFLAPLRNDWSELFRVKVKIAKDPDVVIVRYLDIGTEAFIPTENLVAPLTESFIPEILAIVPPLAVCAKLGIQDMIEPNFCNVLAKELQSKPCYLKMEPQEGEEHGDNLDEPPTVDLHAFIYGDIESLTSLIVPPDEYTESSSNYHKEPLISLLKQLDEWKQKRREAFEQVKRNCILSCDCDTCMDREA